MKPHACALRGQPNAFAYSSMRSTQRHVKACSRSANQHFGSSSSSLLQELLIDKSCNGNPLPRNLTVIAAANPFRSQRPILVTLVQLIAFQTSPCALFGGVWSAARADAQRRCQACEQQPSAADAPRLPRVPAACSDVGDLLQLWKVQERRLLQLCSLLCDSMQPVDAR